MRIDGWRRRLPGVALALIVAGCAGTGASTARGPVAVSDVASVAGKWTGLMEIPGSRHRDDFVELRIDETGHYRALAARTIGVLDAQGQVAVAGDGKLLFKGDRGSQATATLYTQPRQPQRALLLEGATASGGRFSARLHQQP